MKIHLNKWLTIVAILCAGIFVTLMPSTAVADLQILSSYQHIDGNGHYVWERISEYDADGLPIYSLYRESDEFNLTSTTPTRLDDIIRGSYANSEISLKSDGFFAYVTAKGVYDFWEGHGLQYVSGTARAELDMIFTTDSLSLWMFTGEEDYMRAWDYMSVTFNLSDVTPGLERTYLLDPFELHLAKEEGIYLTLFPGHIYELQMSAVNDGYDYSGANISASAVPEPATMLLLGLGLMGLAGVRRKIKK